MKRNKRDQDKHERLLRLISAVIVDYFYHEEIRGTENTGKRNR